MGLKIKYRGLEVDCQTAAEVKDLLVQIIALMGVEGSGHVEFVPSVWTPAPENTEPIHTDTDFAPPLHTVPVEVQHIWQLSSIKPHIYKCTLCKTASNVVDLALVCSGKERRKNKAPFDPIPPLVDRRQ